MRDLGQWLNGSAPGWGAALWRATWQGSVGVGAIWLLCLTFPRIPARARSWCWRLALGKFLVALLWAAPVAIAVLPSHPVSARKVSLPARHENSTPTRCDYDQVQKLIPPGGLAQTRVGLSWQAWLLLVWIAVVVFGIVRLGVSLCKVRRWIRESGSVEDSAWNDELDGLGSTFGCRSFPLLRASGDVNTPVLAGIWRPVILLPASIPGSTPRDQRRMMLAHELAHLKRQDLVWDWLATAVRLLFFFHPVAIFAGRENRVAGEMAADEMVMRQLNSPPAAYAQMLMEAAAGPFAGQEERLVVGMAGSYQTIKRRMQAMKHFHSVSNNRLKFLAAAVALAGILLIVPWRLVAQEEKPRSGKPVVSSEGGGTDEQATVIIDSKGRFKYAGRDMALNETLMALKMELKSNSNLHLSVNLNVKAPFPFAFFNGLSEMKLVHVSVHTPPQVATDARIFDLAFGVWRPEESKQSGPAASGRLGDYWNTVGVAWNNDHTESGLKFADGEASDIRVRMINLAGGWGSNGRIKVGAPMMDSYNYPVNNQGGNSQVILHHVPAGIYDIYLYGHEGDPVAYGDYTLTVGDRGLGRKATSNKADALDNTTWVEGSQYVKYSNVKVNAGEDMTILIQPGGQVTDHWGRTFSDAVICGLQLIPVE